jgi:hypothetical protein
MTTTLDQTVRDALALFESEVPTFPALPFMHPLVIGSGNALEVGRILFRDTAAYFASETDYLRILDLYEPDGAVLISASGSKHATGIAEALTARGVRTVLLTHTKDSPASAPLKAEDVYVFPKHPEPYTYNTSTYFGLVASHERTNGASVVQFLDALTGSVGDIAASAYTLVVPSEYALAAPMVQTKFDELFGRSLAARVYAEEELKHAKTVVPGEGECTIVFGDADDRIVTGRTVRVPLMAGSYLGALAVMYSLVGLIQATRPPLFESSIEPYTKRASEVFNTTITPHVP